MSTSKTKYVDRRIVRAGHTRTLAVGTFLPHSWVIVRIEILGQDEQGVLLHILPLLRDTDA